MGLRMTLTIFKGNFERDIFEPIESNHYSMLFCTPLLTLIRNNKYLSQKKMINLSLDSKMGSVSWTNSETDLWWKTGDTLVQNLRVLPHSFSQSTLFAIDAFHNKSYEKSLLHNVNDTLRIS